MSEHPELLDRDVSDNPCPMCEGALEYTDDPNIVECIICGRRWALRNPDPQVAELEVKLKEATDRAAELEAKVAVRDRALEIFEEWPDDFDEVGGVSGDGSWVRKALEMARTEAGREGL